MKRAVFELVRKFGEPPEDEGLTKTEQKIIDAINAGAETFDEIADYAGITRTSVLTTCQDLYKLAENDGVRYKNKRYMFGQFVKWVRGEYDNM
jgi:predicted transcriptional regulator